VAEAEALDRARRHVLGGDVGLLQELLHDGQPARRLEVDRQRFLVRVEHVEVPRVVGVLPREHPAGGIARLRVLDLDDLGAEPGERLRAGWPGLELGEVDDPDAGETLEVLAGVTHPPILPARWYSVFDLQALRIISAGPVLGPKPHRIRRSVSARATY